MQSLSTVDAQKPRAFARPYFMGAFLGNFFRLLASVKLAVPVLAILIAVLAAGTMVESAQGSEAAKILIYDTLWFAALLVLLGTNVLFAALSRLPWKRKHTGFLLTHLGILMILAGSFVTRHAMIDAQLVITEGQTESSLALPEAVIYLIPVHGGREIAYPLPRKALLWKGRERVLPESPQGQEPELYLTAYYPKARAVEAVESAESGPAALQVSLKNNFVSETQWLLEEPANRSALQLGPAQLVLARTLLEDNGPEQPGAAVLEFSRPGQPPLLIPVPQPFRENETMILRGTPYQITLVKAFSDAVVAGRTLMERPAGDLPDPALPPNAAIQLLLEGEGVREEHTVFAQFPDFSTLHGKKGSETGYRILYRVPEIPGARGGHMLRLIPGENGKLLYQIRTGRSLQGGETREGEEIETGWMGMKLRINHYYEHARLEYRFQPQPNISNARDVSPALEAEIVENGQSRSVRLRQGVSEELVLGGGHYQAVFSQKILPVGFSLELKDFKIKNNPGTRQPASFSSDVVLRDAARGVERAQTISMNQPLDYQGFKIYQSGYVQDEGAPEVSIFSVARDPGIGIKYAGAMVMILGITVMFSMRRLYKTSEKKT